MHDIAAMHLDADLVFSFLTINSLLKNIFIDID